MNSEIKIPTIFGLGVLLVGLAAGTLLVNGNINFNLRAQEGENPLGLAVTNVSGTSASIYWQTKNPVSGYVKAGTTTSLGLTFLDDRDLQKPQDHQIHFVTLTNLSPATTYYFKLGLNGESYPPGNKFLSFKTATSITPQNLEPLTGSVVDKNIQPISEALVNLEIPGAQTLSTVTRVGGNFFISLNTIRNRQTNQNFKLEENTEARLIIISPDLTSKINFKLSVQNPVLPPVVLGQDLELVSQLASPSPTIRTINYDINQDGVVNSLDRNVILKNRGKNPKQKESDLNGDNVVDQKDLNQFDQYLQALPTKKLTK
jgi:hypothetical protein